MFEEEEKEEEEKTLIQLEFSFNWKLILLYI